MIKAILACDETGGIAKDGTLPWPNNPRDLKWYKDNTTNNVIVMGSKTWADPHMPCPMPNRLNVLVTRDKEKWPGAHLYIGDNINESIQSLAEVYADQTVWVIGGAQLINKTLPVIDEFYISRIPGKYECDTFLPILMIEALFEKAWEQDFPGEVKFEIWKRKQNERVS